MIVRRKPDAGIYRSIFETKLGAGGVVASSEGLIEVFTPFAGLSREAMLEGITTAYPSAVGESPVTKRAAELLSRYFAGEVVEFDIPLDYSRATQFQREVYEAVRKIPAGLVKSYSQIAAEIGRERAARGVGSVMARNPLPIVIPCHRVVGKSGSLTGYSAPGGVESKQSLLDLEKCENGLKKP